MEKECTQTKIGFPEDWKIECIKNIAIITTGSRNTQDKIDNGPYPFFVRSQKIERINTYSFDGEAVLTAGDGVGTGKVFHYIKGKFDFHQRVYKISNFSEKIDGFFFFLYFSSAFLKRIMSMTAKSSVDSVRMDMIAEMSIPMPPKEEQTAIGKAILDITNVVNSLDRLIEKKKLIKQGAMQELLTGKKRLIGFANKDCEDWACSTLNELGTFKNGINKNKSEFGYGFPFVNLLDVFGEAEINDINTLGLVNSNENERTIYDLKKGDVIFVRSSVKPEGVGLTTLISKSLPKTVYSGFLIRFRSNSKLSLNFKKYCFSNESFRNRIITNSTVSANTNINQDALNGLILVYPKNLQEQEAIAKILSDMDLEIEALERERDKFRLLKVGLMQQLLTGRIRLKCQN